MLIFLIPLSTKKTIDTIASTCIYQLISGRFDTYTDSQIKKLSILIVNFHTHLLGFVNISRFVGIHSIFF